MALFPPIPAGNQEVWMHRAEDAELDSPGCSAGHCSAKRSYSWKMCQPLPAAKARQLVYFPLQQSTGIPGHCSA